MNVPREFRDVIHDIVDHRRYGYTSVPEFMRDAMRRLLIELDAFPTMTSKRVDKDGPPITTDKNNG